MAPRLFAASHQPDILARLVEAGAQGIAVARGTAWLPTLQVPVWIVADELELAEQICRSIADAPSLDGILEIPASPEWCRRNAAGLWSWLEQRLPRFRAAPGGASLACCVAASACLGNAAKVDVVLHTGNQLLPVIAQLRAARRLMPGARLHCRTLPESLVPGQEDVNLVRLSVQALAAALGGADSLWLAAREPEADYESARLSLRIAQILEREQQVCGAADMLSGAEAIEELTARYEAEARAAAALMR